MINYRVSDDTVMHIATAKALAAYEDNSSTINDKKIHTDRGMIKLFEELAKQYIHSGRDMEGRAPGNQ